VRRRYCGSGVPKVCTDHAIASHKRCGVEFWAFRVAAKLSRLSESTTFVMELTRSLESLGFGDLRGRIVAPRSL
jgi:hypothetical protein